MSIGSKIKSNIPLAPLTTYRVGGPAEFFVEVGTKEDLLDAYAWAEGKKETIYILGGGSNILVADAGVKGLVVMLANRQISVKGQRLHCGAGARLSAAVAAAAGRALSGLEWAAGVPGTVGGAVRGNAGCFSSDTAASVETVEAFDSARGAFRVWSRRDCRFAYRASAFKEEPGLLVWEAVFRLQPGDPARMRRAMDGILAKRAAAFPKLPSAGSVFKNLRYADIAAVNPELAGELERSGAVRDGKVGVRALIERLGLKGRAVGGAKVSLEHGNFIVNTGQARAADIAALIKEVKRAVRSGFGLELAEEIQYFGF